MQNNFDDTRALSFSFAGELRLNHWHLFASSNLIVKIHKKDEYSLNDRLNSVNFFLQMICSCKSSVFRAWIIHPFLKNNDVTVKNLKL